jgi:hypothetical protein
MNEKISESFRSWCYKNTEQNPIGFEFGANRNRFGANDVNPLPMLGFGVNGKDKIYGLG